MTPALITSAKAFAQVGPGWRAECRPGEPEPLRFMLPEIDAELRFAGVRLDDLGEELAEIRKCRAHRFLEAPGGRGEMLAILPFGSEPHFARRWTAFGRMVDLVTEIRTHPGTIVQNFAVDELLALGDWRRGSWFAFDPSSGQITRTDFAWPEHDGIVVAATPQPPLTVILENTAGGRLELGTGEDWWRWQTPPLRFGGTGRYCLRRAGNAARLERIVLALPESGPLPSRPWRFGSYFAWHPRTPPPTPPSTCATPLPPPGASARPAAATISLSPEGWPTSALALDPTTAAPRLCLLAPAVRGALRRWLRSRVDLPCATPLALVEIRAGLCSAAAHLERPQREVLPHWDLPELFSFWSWANRQLHPKGQSLQIFPAAGEMFSDLPALLGMGEPLASDHCPGMDP